MQPTTAHPAPDQAGESQKQPRIRDGYDFAHELAFTETYRRYRDAHPAIREAMCLRVQYPAVLTAIEPGDLFAGRIEPALVGFSPDEWGQTAFGYYYLPDRIEAALAHGTLPADHRRAVEAMCDFWRTENTSAQLRAAYPAEMARWLPSDRWMDEPGIAFPLYRLTGGTVHYGPLMRLGLPGLRREVEAQRACAEAEGRETALYDGFRLMLELTADVCRHYAAQARTLAAQATADRRRDLLALAETLEDLTVAPPKHFRHALQLFWLYAILGDIRNHGRMDTYLGDFLARDLETGVLTEAEALRLLQSVWQLMADRNTRVHNRVIVGGLGRAHEAAADRFALLAMEATRTVPEVEPQLSLRFYPGMNPALMQKALDVIGEGRTYPILYNDAVNVPAVMQAFGFDRATAEQYVPYGCGEYIIEGQSFGTPSGVVNLLKALEVTLHDGRDPVSGRPMGLALGTLHDFETFDDLWRAYTRQVEHFVNLMAEQERLAYDVAGRETACLYLSLLYDDCLPRGRAIFSGGLRYLGGTLETYGNANTADSLTALDELLYKQQALTPDELLAALDADFEGHDRVRHLLQQAPKYGNDDDVADAMLVRVHEHVCRYVRDQKDRVGLHTYLVVVINNSANTLMGRHTAASPDGRRAGTPMNNGNNPSSGSDRKGITAFLNSIVKPSPNIHAGAVQNMKFSPDLFQQKRPVLRALLDTYFDRGGAQAMITVVSRGDLERAMQAPEQYRNLFVRVGGFSARFVDLPRDVQLEILHRTLY